MGTLKIPERGWHTPQLAMFLLILILSFLGGVSASGEVQRYWLDEGTVKVSLAVEPGKSGLMVNIKHTQ